MKTGGGFDQASSNGHQADILFALKKAGGSMKPGELQRAVGANNAASLRYWIAPLIESKQIVATGQTAGRRFSLPSQTPALGAPGPALPAVEPGPRAAVSSSTDLVNRRDQLIAAAVKASKMPVAFKRLMDVMPDEPWANEQEKQQALSNALARLRMKKVLRLIDGEGWVAA